MTLIKEIDLLENKKNIIWLNVASVILMILFIFFFGFIATLILGNGAFEQHFDLSTSFKGFLIMFGIVIVHELIHGLFFKLFNPEGKVKFGFKNGMAYATSPQSIYTKGQFSIIILAPFVIINSLIFIAFLLGWFQGIAFIFFSAFHAASCVGDFYFILLLLTTEKGAYVEDTEVGITFYRSNQA